MFAVMQGGLPQVQAGKLRAVAVTGAKRAPALPDVPTVIEAGLPGRRLHLVERRARESGHAARARREAERRIESRARACPTCRERMAALGLEPAGGTPEAFGEFVKEDIARWAKVIKAANVRAD